MSSTDETPKRTDRTPPWKRLILIGASLGAGIALVGMIAAVGIRWYRSRPLPVHEWARLDINSYGLEARLKTEWRNDGLYYQFVLSPSSQRKVKAFAAAVRSYQGPMLLTVRLYDSSGFQLCSNLITGSDMSQNIDDTGEIAGLSANGFWSSCSRGRYLESRKWDMTWSTLPNISAGSGQPSPSSKAPASHKARRAESVGSGEILSGIDVIRGKLDTESGHVFSVYESGERYTIIGWSAGERIECSCDTHSNCLIEDTTNGERVHAHLVR